MRHLGLPTYHQQLVASYFDYVWYRHNDFDGHRFLERLPETLRGRVSLKVHGEMVRRVPAFQHCPSQVLSLICMALEPQIYLPADTVSSPTPSPNHLKPA